MSAGFLQPTELSDCDSTLTCCKGVKVSLLKSSTELDPKAIVFHKRMPHESLSHSQAWQYAQEPFCCLQVTKFQLSDHEFCTTGQKHELQWHGVFRKSGTLGMHHDSECNQRIYHTSKIRQNASCRWSVRQHWNQVDESGSGISIHMTPIHVR